MHFKNFFFFCALSEKRSGLKTDVQNSIFWSEIVSGFEEPGCTPPPRISQKYPSPGGGGGTRLKVRKNMVKTFISVQKVKFLS